MAKLFGMKCIVGCSKTCSSHRCVIIHVISAFCAVAIFAFSFLFIYYTYTLPSTESLKHVHMQIPLHVYSSDHRLIAEFGEKRCAPVMFKHIPASMINAFISAEDADFYSNSGVDLSSLLRAAWGILSTGNIKTGGSTITMQVARNFFLTSERSFLRKFKEIMLALRINKMLSKKEIVTLYLNKIYLGNRAYGVEAAAQVYYGKSIHELTLAETAMIAGLPKAPSAYNPIINRQRSLKRRNWILARMLKLKHITQGVYHKAIEEPITARYHSTLIELQAPYVAEMVRPSYGGSLW